MLFPSEEDMTIMIDEKTIQTFFDMYDATPGFSEAKDGKGCYIEALEKAKKFQFLSR